MPTGEHLKGRSGPESPTWKGGLRRDRKGYLMRNAPDHPWPRAGGYVYEHVRIMELHIGRRIVATVECVHHVDGDIDNNALENLELMDHGEHTRRHQAEKRPTHCAHGHRLDEENTYIRVRPDGVCRECKECSRESVRRLRARRRVEAQDQGTSRSST